MQTKEQIKDYLLSHYPTWDMDNYEFFTELIWDILQKIPDSSLSKAYLDIGEHHRKSIAELEDNIAVIILNVGHDRGHANLELFLKDALSPYRHEGVDAYNTIYSMNQLIITMDMAY